MSGLDEMTEARGILVSLAAVPDLVRDSLACVGCCVSLLRPWVWRG